MKTNSGLIVGLVLAMAAQATAQDDAKLTPAQEGASR